MLHAHDAAPPAPFLAACRTRHHPRAQLQQRASGSLHSLPHLRYHYSFAQPVTAASLCFNPPPAAARHGGREYCGEVRKCFSVHRGLQEQGGALLAALSERHITQVAPLSLIHCLQMSCHRSFRCEHCFGSVPPSPLLTCCGAAVPQAPRWRRRLLTCVIEGACTVLWCGAITRRGHCLWRADA